jgi:hypothetical protein
MANLTFKWATIRALRKPAVDLSATPVTCNFTLSTFI